MKIVNRKIKDLIGAEYNPRELTKDQYKQLKDSLLRFGVVDPVIVNKHPERDNIIIGGHQRSKVWGDMGNESIPTVELSLTLDKEKELNVRLNKNTGQFDMDMLANNFDTDELIEWGFDAGELLGKDVDDLDDGEEIELPQSLQVIPKTEYIVICADENSLEWEELKEFMQLKQVRSGGCKIGSSSDKVGKGLERVFSFYDFKERIGV
tara:strand:- start:1724 stop:2347 length:624 start_codon:yes stop_codon:yes gene_type:complete